MPLMNKGEPQSRVEGFQLKWEWGLAQMIVCCLLFLFILLHL